MAVTEDRAKVYREAFHALPLDAAVSITCACALAVVSRNIDRRCDAALSDLKLGESARRSIGQTTRHIGASVQGDMARIRRWLRAQQENPR